MIFSRATYAMALALVFCETQACAGDAAQNYLLHCSGCHGMDGLGSKVGRIPPFPGMIGPISRAKEGRAYLVLVPGVADAALSDGDTADVLNYVLAHWAGERSDLPTFHAGEVHEIRRRKVDDIAAMRTKIANELATQDVSIRY